MGGSPTNFNNASHSILCSCSTQFCLQEFNSSLLQANCSSSLMSSFTLPRLLQPLTFLRTKVISAVCTSCTICDSRSGVARDPNLAGCHTASTDKYLTAVSKALRSFETAVNYSPVDRPTNPEDMNLLSVSCSLLLF